MKDKNSHLLEERYNIVLEQRDRIERVNWDPSTKAYGGTGITADWGYFGFLVWMKPKAFLNLAKPLGDPHNYEFVESIMLQGDPIAPPWLIVEWIDDTEIYKVTGHEGRHRCTVLVKHGYNHDIPVIFNQRSKRARHLTEQQVKSVFNFMINEDGHVVQPGIKKIKWLGDILER